MAAGAGMYVVAGVATILIIAVLSLLDWVEGYAKDRLGLGPDGTALAREPDDARPDGRSDDLA
jgi:uncharacterized membrane protein YhiD involved in acid resistance